MARGRFAHTIDAKGRVSIPAGFRVELQASEDRPPIITHLVDELALGLYSHDQWEEIERRLNSMSQTQPDVQRVKRMLFSGATDAPIDGQGRISIPQHLREYAGLEREVVIAGVGARIEIWDRSRFGGVMPSTPEDRHRLSSIAAEAGL